MIKNERQYRVTKAQADKFRRALDGLGKRTSPETQVHPLLQKAQEDALRSQLEQITLLCSACCVARLSPP